MTDAAITTALAARRERQARVGILRNPNSPPTPPARRVALTGKWMRLRSTRRPRSASSPAEDAGTVAPAFVIDDGTGPRINLDALEQSVAGLSAKPQRRAFAQDFRPGPPPAPPRQGPVTRPLRPGTQVAVSHGAFNPGAVGHGAAVQMAAEPDGPADAQVLSAQPGGPTPHVGAILVLLSMASLWVFLLRLAGP